MTDDLELHARTGDPATSHAAMAAYDKERMANAADFVVTLYRRDGRMADYQLRDRFAAEWGAPCSPHLYRQARSVARDQGLIRDTGLRVKNPETNRLQILWELCADAAPLIHRCPTCGKLTGRSLAPPPKRGWRSLYPTPPTVQPKKKR